MESSLFAEQKKSKPDIMEIINEKLAGDAKESASAFVAYLRENQLTPRWASANSWKVSYKNKGVCYIKIDQHGRNMFWVNPMAAYTLEYIGFVEKENLREVIWQNLGRCTRCHPSTCAKAVREPEGSFSGVRKAFFGKEFDGICRGGDTSFINPGDEATECLKRLIAFRRQVIDQNAVPKVDYVSPERRGRKADTNAKQTDTHSVG